MVPVPLREFVVVFGDRRDCRAARAVAPDCTPQARELVLPLDHFPVRG
jgi:hypothetical protein